MLMAQMDAALEPPKKKSLMPLLIGLGLMLALGGGAFYTVYSGLIFGHPDVAAVPKEKAGEQKVNFVALDPMVISLGESGARHLRFSAQLEVENGREAEVEQLKPRVMDVLNGYLRAVDIAQIEDPSALIRLRAQMLRRIRIVTGEGLVRDLLIIEFVMN